MKILLTCASILLFANLYAENKTERTNYPIQYIDTNYTYIQLYVIDSNTNEELIKFTDFEFSSGTNKEIKYTRYFDAFNVPLATKFPAGVYNIKGKSFISKNVEIKENKVNIIKVLLTQSRLIFTYVNDRTKPVTNQATVKRRFSNDSTAIIQNCSESKSYNSGTYYVEINTFPVSRFSIDMDYGALYELQIPKPAKLVINDISGISNIELYDERGDEWRICKKIDSTYPKNNPLIIQPWKYKMLWIKNEMNFEKTFRVKEDAMYEFTFDPEIK